MFTKTEKTILNALPNEHEAHGGGWLQDWLKDFMWEYGLDPADLLMEEKKNT